MTVCLLYCLYSVGERELNIPPRLGRPKTFESRRAALVRSLKATSDNTAELIAAGAENRLYAHRELVDSRSPT